MTRKRRRLYLVTAAMACLGAATALVLNAFSDTLVYFYTPSEVSAKHVAADRDVRIGGLVLEGSVKRDGRTLHFSITDRTASLPVSYNGDLPDLFREGQGVVAEGKLDSQGALHASEILAKHDENYMPKEVADALKKSGHWQGEEKDK